MDLELVGGRRRGPIDTTGRRFALVDGGGCVDDGRRCRHGRGRRLLGSAAVWCDDGRRRYADRVVDNGGGCERVLLRGRLGLRFRYERVRVLHHRDPTRGRLRSAGRGGRRRGTGRAWCRSWSLLPRDRLGCRRRGRNEPNVPGRRRRLGSATRRGQRQRRERECGNDEGRQRLGRRRRRERRGPEGLHDGRGVGEAERDEADAGKPEPGRPPAKLNQAERLTRKRSSHGT